MRSGGIFRNCRAVRKKTGRKFDAFSEPTWPVQVLTSLIRTQLKDAEMSGVADEYRMEAEACRKWAELSVKQEDVAFWLLMAESWRKLAQSREEKPGSELQNSDASVLLRTGS